VSCAGVRVALDTVCGAGGPVMALLLKRLGAEVAVHLHAETSGVFPRPPEPIPEHLTELGAAVRMSGAAVGIAVDPDVDRCVVLDEHGKERETKTEGKLKTRHQGILWGKS
jgi:phosphomannomutase